MVIRRPGGLCESCSRSICCACFLEGWCAGWTMGQAKPTWSWGCPAYRRAAELHANHIPMFGQFGESSARQSAFRICLQDLLGCGAFVLQNNFVTFLGSSGWILMFYHGYVFRSRWQGLLGGFHGDGFLCSRNATCLQIDLLQTYTIRSWELRCAGAFLLVLAFGRKAKNQSCHNKKKKSQCGSAALT